MHGAAWGTPLSTDKAAQRSKLASKTLMSESLLIAHDKDTQKSYRLRRLFKSNSISTVDSALAPASPESKRSFFFVNNSLEKLHGCDDLPSPGVNMSPTPGPSPSRKRETERHPHRHQLEGFRSTSTLSAGNSTPSSGKTSLTESYCAVCDFPLVYKLTNEHTVGLDCGHRAHQECYSNTAVQADFKLQCASCRTSSHRLEIRKEENDMGCDGMNTCLNAPLPQAASTSDAVLSARSISSKFLGCDSGAHLSLKPENFLPIRASIVPAYDCISVDTKTLLCLAIFEVPHSLETDYDYRSSAADINYGRAFTEEVSNLKFQGKSLASVFKGRLRLLDTLYVASRNSAWARCRVYLFSKLMIICRADSQGNQAVQFLLNVKDIEQVHIKDLEMGKSLCLINLSKSLPELFLSAEDVGVLHKWQLALYNPKYEFSLAPQISDIEKISKNDHVTREPHVPLDLVLCISLSDVADSVKTRTVVKAIQKLQSNMNSFDRLGIIFFGHSFLKSYALCRKTSGSWDTITEDLASIANSNAQSSFDYNGLLSCCEALLRTYCATRSYASVIIVSDLKGASFSRVPWTFLQAGTPINTFDVSSSNPDLLSRISYTTGGRYVLLEGVTSLLGPLEELVKLEQAYKLKNNLVFLQASGGMQIDCVQSSGFLKSCDIPLTSRKEGTILSAAEHSDAWKNASQLEIGNLRVGHSCTILVELSRKSKRDTLCSTPVSPLAAKAASTTDENTPANGVHVPTLELLNIRWDANEILSLNAASDYSIVTNAAVEITPITRGATAVSIEVLYYKACLDIADLLSGISIFTSCSIYDGVFDLVDAYLKEAEATLCSPSNSSRASCLKYGDTLTSFIVATRETICYYHEKLAAPDRALQLASLVTDTIWCLKTRHSYTSLTPLHVHFLNG